MTFVDDQGLKIYAESRVEHAGTRYALVHDPSRGGKLLAVWGDETGFVGKPHPVSGALLCPANAATAAVLRGRLP